MWIRIVLLLTCAALAAAQNGFYLKDGDRVVFYGDSITEQRLYTTFAETYAITRFPSMKVTFTHSGWGGDRVNGGGGGPIDVRLQRDVIPYKPTVMTIMLGMNDGRYRAFDDELFKAFTSGYENIVKTMKAAMPGLRITVIQPSPYDDVTRAPNFAGGYNAVLVRYSKYLKELATREDLQIADLNTDVVAALARADSSDHEAALKIVPDRIHPGAGGHLLMAECLLKAWNAPALVSSLEIDAAARKTAAEVNTSTAGWSFENGIRWTETDAALPMPVNMADQPTALAVKSSDFIDALNRQMLKVTGLNEGKYELRIDGEPVGTFTGSELALGVNLAVLPTPMAKQAAAVHALTLKRSGIHQTRWRTLQVPLTSDHLAHLDSAIEQLDALDNDLMQQQRAVAQPLPHKFELVSQKEN